MIGLFLGDSDFSEIVLKKIKKQKAKYLLLIFQKKINLRKTRILSE